MISYKYFMYIGTCINVKKIYIYIYILMKLTISISLWTLFRGKKINCKIYIQKSNSK